VKTQIKASFFFSLLDPSGSRSTPCAILPPSSSTAAHRRRGVRPRTCDTREARSPAARECGGGDAVVKKEERCGRRREREGERRGESESEKLTAR
jgi:hypothetical protein